MQLTKMILSNYRHLGKEATNIRINSLIVAIFFNSSGETEL